MINTYQTSLHPPPVPPRLGRSHPVLIQEQLPLRSSCRSLIWFLIGFVLVHAFLSVIGFIYLYNNGKMGKHLLSEGEVFHPPANFLSSDERPPSALARMVVQPNTEKATSGYLMWNVKHSFFREIDYYHDIWLTVRYSGYYFVYSRVSFSKSNPVKPLASIIKLRKSDKEKEETVMVAYCNTNNHSGAQSVPHMCTASQGEVIKLESGNQLSVWVQNLTFVDYEEGATTFGMYKL